MLDIADLERTLKDLTAEIIEIKKKLNDESKEIGFIPVQLQDIEVLAGKYKERGDKHINLYLSKYVKDNDDIQMELADKSLDDYKSSIRLYGEIGKSLDIGYVVMAYGNAFKEKHLPGMPCNSFEELAKEANAKYNRCVEIFLDIKEIRGYHFAMLEQMNLWVRKKVWKNGKSPKRIVIFHSLKSPESHIYLQGIRSIAYKNYCEVWDYHYGRVPPRDIDRSFIKDRLLDAGAAIFLVSKDYDKRREVIRFEIEETKKLKQNKGTNKDPIRIFVVNLDNENVDVVRDLKEVARKVVSPEKVDVDDEFKKFLNENEEINHIHDIYDCRRSRIKNDNYTQEE